MKGPPLALDTFIINSTFAVSNCDEAKVMTFDIADADDFKERSGMP
jgi:hypothetical protein